MNKEEFLNKIYELATEHAKSCVFDPEEHADAVEAIAYDFSEGAYAAYRLLTGDVI